jgi:DNA repair exonuclease SbcCD nuclease subunit
MPILKLLHTADIHLGFSMFNKTTERGRNARSVDVERTWYRLIERAVPYQPDILIVAGDLFHRPHPGMHAIHTARRALRYFLQHCPSALVFLVGGNHDTARTRTDSHPLHLLGELDRRVLVSVWQPGAYSVRVRGLLVQLAAIPSSLPDMYSTDPGGRLIQPVVEPDPGTDFRVLVLHGVHEQVLPFHGGSTSWLIRREYYTSPLWDYIAWGDYHDYIPLSPREYYSGAIDFCSTNVWSERSSKCGLLVMLHSDRAVPTVQPISTEPRPHYCVVVQHPDEVEQALNGLSNLTEAAVRVVLRTAATAEESRRQLMQIRREWCRRVWVLHAVVERIRPPVAFRRSTPLDMAERWRRFVLDTIASGQPLPDGISVEDIIRRGLDALAISVEEVQHVSSSGTSYHTA